MSPRDPTWHIRVRSRPSRACVRARGWLILLAFLASAIACPSSAHADADPASDVLLAQNVFYPYQPPVSPALNAATEEALLEAGRSGLKLKVAIIGSPEDLGAVFDLFGHPQQYALFLDREISFNHRQPLMVVMPAGFGTVAAGPPGALAGVKVDAKHGSYGLTRSAILAIVALARAGGRTIATPAIPPESSAAHAGGPPALLLFGAPVVLLVLVALVIRRRGASSAHDAGVPE
jgi:hypothetical protein